MFRITTQLTCRTPIIRKRGKRLGIPEMNSALWDADTEKAKFTYKNILVGSMTKASELLNTKISDMGTRSIISEDSHSRIIIDVTSIGSGDIAFTVNCISDNDDFDFLLSFFGVDTGVVDAGTQLRLAIVKSMSSLIRGEAPFPADIKDMESGVVSSTEFIDSNDSVVATIEVV